MSKKIIIFVAFLTVLLMITPFFASLGMAAIFAVLFFPLMNRIDKGPFPNSVAAGVFTLFITLVLFIPIAVFSVIGVKAGLSKLKEMQLHSHAAAQADSTDLVATMIDSAGIKKLLVKASTFFPIDPESSADQLADVIKVGANYLGDVLTTFISNIPSMAIAFIVFLFAFFYFLTDQKRIVSLIKQYSVFSAAETTLLFNTFGALCRSVILAGVASGFAQASLAALLCLIVGIHAVFTVFALVLVFSFIPLIGSAPIMITLTLSQFFSGNIKAGIIMTAGMMIIGGIDNVIRPQVIRRGGYDLHPLLGFISALAGLQIFGVTGVFVGPVVFGLGIEILRISQED